MYEQVYLNLLYNEHLDTMYNPWPSPIIENYG